MNEEQITQAVLAYDALKMHEFRLGYRKLPSFIGIGPARAGTSSLYALLRRNAGVHIAPAKEVNFFGFRSRSRSGGYAMTLEEYSTFFIGAAREVLCGEISPSYFILPDALPEIAERLPGCRIVSGLRNPLERLYSHFKFHQKMHGCGDFDEFVDSARSEFASIYDPDFAFRWFKPVRALASSLYADTLGRCVANFPRKDVHVYLFEDFVRDPAVVTGIQTFIGVEPVADAPGHYNASDRGEGEIVLRPDNAKWLREVFRSDLDRVQELGLVDVGGYLGALAR